MKKIVEVDEKGLESLLGERVLLMCANYFYTGKLVGVNSTFVVLEDPAIVYETGDFCLKNFKDEQKLHVKQWYVQTRAIESYGLGK
jgi:hypothetical protein